MRIFNSRCNCLAQGEKIKKVNVVAQNIIDFGINELGQHVKYFKGEKFELPEDQALHLAKGGAVVLTGKKAQADIEQEAEKEIKENAPIIPKDHHAESNPDGTPAASV